jgi:hypothetical protein
LQVSFFACQIASGNINFFQGGVNMRALVDLATGAFFGAAILGWAGVWQLAGFGHMSHHGQYMCLGASIVLSLWSGFNLLDKQSRP